MRKFLFLFLAVYACIFGLLLNYENTWMHPEMVKRTGDLFWDNGGTIERWQQMFNWHFWEGDFENHPCARARIFSHIMLTTNALFRNWLFQYVPPHPSLSLTWIFTLFLGPYFLYQLVRNLIGNKETGLMTSLIHLALPGTLIPIIMMFHAGKPMSNFFYIFCLYLGSAIYQNLDKLPAAVFKKKFLGLAITILLAFFFDEYSLFIWILIPIFYPHLFTGPCRKYVYILYGSLPILYFLSVIYFLPKFYNFLGYPGFNIFSFVDIHNGLPLPNVFYTFINFILSIHDNLQAGFNVYLRDEGMTVVPTQFLSVSNQLTNAHNIRVGLSLVNEQRIFVWQIIHNFLSLAVLLVLLFALLKRKPETSDPAARNYFIKAALALLGYTIFFSYLHLSNNIISGIGWYGCNFSILFAIWLGLGLHIILQTFSWSKILVWIFIVSLIGNTLWNTKLLNLAWLAMHGREKFDQCDLWLNKKTRLYLYEKYYVPKVKNNFEKTLAAWRNRKQANVAKGILGRAYPEVQAYLYAELPFVK